MTAGVSWSDQVAIVTGAGLGLGREIALLLGELGVRVLVNDYGGDGKGFPGTPERAEGIAREIRERGGRATANGAAVGTAAAARSICDAALAAYGRIDILVNNAGVMTTGPIDQIPDADLTRLVEINFLGAFRLVQAVWPTMKRQSYGRILNVASNSALGIAGCSSYGASKAGVMGLTASAALEGIPFGIKVNSLLPAAWTRLVEDSVSLAAPDFADWFKQRFPPQKIAPVAVALVSKGLSASGIHFSTGAGRVTRLAQFSTRGAAPAVLDVESVLDALPQAEDTAAGIFVNTAFEELNLYAGTIGGI